MPSFHVAAPHPVLPILLFRVPLFVPAIFYSIPPTSPPVAPGLAGLHFPQRKDPVVTKSPPSLDLSILPPNMSLISFSRVPLRP